MPNRAPETPRWYSPWRWSARRAAAPDAADHGTCFGLEMSLSEPLPLSATPAERRSGWVRRLTQRRRGAT